MRSVLVSLAAILVGCAAAGPGAGPPEFDGAPVAILASDSGRLVVSVWTWPAPLSRGVDAVRLRIADAAGAPVDGAAVTATPWMPAHGHGTSVEPSVTPGGDGVYDVDDVLFYMDGRWELRTRIDVPGADADTLVATFDVR